jgi:hypothetical protein
MRRTKWILAVDFGVFALALLMMVAADAHVRATDDSSSSSTEKLFAIGPATKEQHPFLTKLFTWPDKNDKDNGDKDNDAKDDGDAKGDPLESDRPNFTQGPSTVGYKRLQIESGYTYTQAVGGNAMHDTHDLPEMLVRYGLAERLEFRLSWEGAVFDGVTDRATGRTVNQTGYTDVDIGLKYAISKQHEWLPAMSLIVDVSAPAGSYDQTSHEADAEIIWSCSWSLTKRLTLSSSTGNVCTRESDEHLTRFSQSACLDYGLTENLHIFNEWYVSCPKDSENDLPQHYYDSGFTYLVAPSFQLDWRAGIGLSDASDGFFTGCGLTFRR